MDIAKETTGRNRKPRQVDMLAEYMIANSSEQDPITQLMATPRLGIGRLAARIGELKKDGFLRNGIKIQPKVEDRWLKVTKSDGSVANVKGYWCQNYNMHISAGQECLPFPKLNEILAEYNTWYIFECPECGHMDGTETLLVNTSTGNVVCGACNIESDMNIKSRVKTKHGVSF